MQAIYNSRVDAAAIHGEIILGVTVLGLAGQVVLVLLQMPALCIGMIIVPRLRGKVVKITEDAV